MLKKFLSLLLFAILFLACDNIKAEYSASVTASSKTVTVGQNVTITVSAKNLMGVYTIESSDSNVLAGNDSDSIDSPDPYTRSFTFSAKAPGTATLTFAPSSSAGLTDYDILERVSFTRTVTINVVKKEAQPSIDVNKTYSKNNNLKSLTVEGYDFNFDKDILEYTIELEPGTEKVIISAVKEDNSANIKGIGEFTVSEGINTAEIIVTAENGNEKVYILRMNVEEKNPINVKINDKEYRVVKKRELIEKKDNFDEVDVDINNIAIPGLYNSVTKVTLVGLKDSEGNIKYFSYDSTTGKYKEYNEFKFDLMNLYITAAKKSKYDKIKITINDIEVPAYKVDGVDDYYLLYATNTSTGYKGYYLYDKKENSVQRYDSRMLEKIMQEKDKYFNIVLVLSCVCFLSMMFLLLEINRDNKREC